MPLRVLRKHLQMVNAILERHVPNHEVWGFGSRVNGTSKKTSDLDLVVIADEPLSFETLAGLRDDFSESNIPYKVDVVDWATTSESFREIIQRDHVILQSRQNS